MEIFMLGSMFFMYGALFLLLMALSFLPTIVALIRKHPDVLWIFIVNFGLGATALGWIVALVWACKSDWRLFNIIGKSFKNEAIKTDTNQ